MRRLTQAAPKATVTRLKAHIELLRWLDEIRPDRDLACRVQAIVIAGGLDDQITAHTGRHTFATTLIRGGTDLVLVAEMLGHARLETVHTYTRRTAEDRVKALALLPTDR